jgi:hypothetical protein
MGRRSVGIILLLAGSVAIGALLGWFAYGVFKTNVPQQLMAVSDKVTVPSQFVGAGAAWGLLIFAWSLLAVACSRWFLGRGPKSGA